MNGLAPAKSTDGRGQEPFLRPFFLALSARAVRYCVLHSYEQLPFYTESDVDMAVHGITRDECESLLQRVARGAGWEIVQRLWYDVPTCFYYVVRSLSEPRAWVAVDILLDRVGIGSYAFDTDVLTRDAVAEGVFFHSNSSVEFCYKLTKRIRKGQLKPTDLVTLQMLHDEADKTLIRSILSHHYGAWGARRILAGFESTDRGCVRLPDIRALSVIQLLKRRYFSIPRLLKRLAWQVRRVCNRVSDPAGVVLWVPYASEKDLRQLAEALWTRVGPAFRRLRIEPISSAWQRFAALSSSTLLICLDADESRQLRVQSAMLARATRVDVAVTPRASSVADAAESAVLKVLRSRMTRRLPQAPERSR